MSKLNSEFTFDTFSVKENNQSAYEAALAVAKSPGKIHNPLFIYGEGSVGKTHLMQAIAHSALKNHPVLKTLYLVPDEFKQHFTYAFLNINGYGFDKFYAKYSSIDILLFDDFQLIFQEGKAEESFFHIFDMLYKSQKQIIISIDSLLDHEAVTQSDYKFHSYFKLGLSVTIDNPNDYETRIAIIQNCLKDITCHLDDSVIHYIASNITTANSLNLAVNELGLFSLLENISEITLDMAKKVLCDRIPGLDDKG